MLAAAGAVVDVRISCSSLVSGMLDGGAVFCLRVGGGLEGWACSGVWSAMSSWHACLHGSSGLVEPLQLLLVPLAHVLPSPVVISLARSEFYASLQHGGL